MDLQEISDRLEIQDLLARYTYAVDAQDWDVLDRTFTPDATIDFSATGGVAGSFGEARAWLVETLPGPFASTMHMLGLPVIDLDGEHATVTAYLDNPMRCATAGAARGSSSSAWSTATSSCVRRTGGGSAPCARSSSGSGA